jgi:hypothetical protein
LPKHPRKLENNNVREGSRLSSASKPPQSSQEPPVAVGVEVIPENTDKMNAPVQTMVVVGLIPGKNVVRDSGHEGPTLQQYCEKDAAKDAYLNEAAVVGLRLTTARLFRSFDKALRDKEGWEELATCIAVMRKSVIQLLKNAPAGWLMCCWYKLACFYHDVSFR